MEQQATGSFGRYFSGRELDGDYQSTDDESGEDKSLDTSEEETEEEVETEDEESEGDDEGESEEKSKDKPDFKALYEDSESKRRLTQSNLNTVQNEVRQIRQEITEFKEDSETRDPFEGMDETEVLDVATAKKVLASVQPKAKKKNPVQSEPDPNFNNWMETQPGIEEINAYYKEHEADVNLELRRVPTNEYGQFLMISKLQKEDALKKLQDENKKLKKKLSKKKVPQMGPAGNSGKGRQSKPDAASPLLRYFQKGRKPVG